MQNSASAGHGLHQTHAWLASSRRVQDGGEVTPFPALVTSPPSSFRSASSCPSMVAIGAPAASIFEAAEAVWFDSDNPPEGCDTLDPPPLIISVAEFKAVSFLEKLGISIFSLGEPRPPPPLSEFNEFCDVPDKEAVAEAEVGEVPLPTTMLIF